MHLRPRLGCADVGPTASSGTAWQSKQRQHRLRQRGAASASVGAATPEQLEQWVSDSNQQRLTALEASRAAKKQACQLCARLGWALGLDL